MVFTAVLISRFGEFSDITYTSLSNLKTKFSKKGSGKPVILHTWHLTNISIMGYTQGSEININKHELPPPIDTKLFYGDLIVFIKKDNFTSENYQTFYDDIFQFEDLDDFLIQDELLDQEEDEYDFDDGFVVRDEDCDENFVITTDEED